MAGLRTLSPVGKQAHAAIVFVLVSLCLDVVSYSSASAATSAVGPGQSHTTIQSAIDAAAGKDVVLIHPGTYIENVVIDKALTVKADRHAKVVLQGHIVVKANDVIVEGLEITGWGASDPDTDGIVAEKQSGLNVDSCIIHAGPGSGAPIQVGTINGSLGRGTAAGIRIRNSSKTRITNNDIYGCIKGIRIQSSHSTDDTFENGTVISSNKVHDCPIDGLNVQGQYITIEDCMIYDNMDVNFAKNHPDGIQFVGALNTDGYNAVQHARVLRNTIYNQTQQIFLQGTLAKRGGAGGGENSDCTDVLIANNVCYNVGGEVVHGQLMSALPAGLGIGFEACADVSVYNNTVTNLNLGIGVTNCKDRSVHIKNNILAHNKNAIRVIDPNDLAPGELDYNLFFDNKHLANWGSVFHRDLTALRSAAAGQARHCVEANPKLTEALAPVPSAGSAAVAAGVNLSKDFTTDRAGNKRSSSAAWDIGAFQTATSR